MAYQAPNTVFGYSKLFSIPNIPSVAREGHRWSALTEAVVLEYRHLAAEAINEFTNRVAEASLVEVPKRSLELATSIRFPANDPASAAHEDLLWASVSYDTIYAAVQHEGMAIMHHHHPIEPDDFGGFHEDITQYREVVIEWVAEFYTTPGTKSHFLSDPELAFAPLMDEMVGSYIRERMPL